MIKIDNDFPGKSINIAPVIGAAVAALTNPVGTVIGEAKKITDNMSAVASQSTMLSNLPEENFQNNLVKPKSGINFVLYNSRFDVVEENTGYLPVENHINAIQNLATDKLIMKEAGFIEIFVNNQAQTPVYYDNMMVTHSGGNVVEVNAYYPYGMRLPLLSTPANTDALSNLYLYSAKELQEMTGWHDFGNRMQDPVTGRFTTSDRFAEKYYHLSPYQYAANNPINYIDINGDSLWITHRTGFLGLGGKETLLYENWSLYNSDGSAYEGKVNGFLKRSVNDLGTISQSAIGAGLLSELQSSDNNFTIEKSSKSEFVSNDPVKAYATQLQADPSQASSLSALTSAGKSLIGGSGGTIRWNPSGTTIQTLSGLRSNGAVDLAHELFHGQQANNGLLDSRRHQGIPRNDWGAVYNENMLRGQLGLPLRTHYQKSVTSDGVIQGGTGARMLTPFNMPILPIYPIIPRQVPKLTP